MSVAQYKCAQEDFYSAAEFGWGVYTDNQSRFMAFKPSYTIAKATAALAAIAAAQEMADEQGRYADREVLRIRLHDQAEEVLYQWNLLDGYLVSAYPKAEQKAMREAAGHGWYSKAGDDDWTAVQALINKGAAFAAEHSAVLEMNQNMPASFPDTLGEVKDTFKTLHKQFVDSGQQAQEGTSGKTDASNACYRDLMAMLEDGQRIFRKEPELARKFTFDYLLGLVRGTKAAGLKGVVKDDQGKVLANVAVKALQAEKETVTDEAGKWEIHLPSGVYDVEFTGAGFEKQLVKGKEVKVGVVSHFDVVLVNAGVLS